MNTPVIIFLGIPGSGKGTQAVRVAQTYNMVHVSTGDLLRALEQNPVADPADTAALVAMKTGGLVSATLIYKLAFSAMRSAFVAGKGCVLDGAIRTVEQAEAYSAFCAESGVSNSVLAIHISLTDEESIKRLMLRKRADDTEDIIRERLRTQGNASLQPLLHFYEDMGVLETIQGVATIFEVESQIVDVLKKRGLIDRV